MNNQTIENYIERARKELAPLNFSGKPVYSRETTGFFEFYGINFRNTKHIFGTFKSNNHTLAAHFFIPENSKASVLLIHGYFGHTGMLKNLIRILVEHNYTVAIYDLQGHGLSTGDRLSVNDFSGYAAVFDDFVNICKKELKAPFHLLGYSLGGGIALDYVLNAKNIIFDKIILAAPLVHSAFWYPCRAFYPVIRPFVKSVPRHLGKVSSDEEFMDFIDTKDPMQYKKIPGDWIESLFRWNDRNSRYKPFDKPVKVIQGTKDNVVQWKFNMKYLRGKFNSMSLSLIKGARHELFNEAENIKTEALNEVLACLQGAVQ